MNRAPTNHKTPLFAATLLLLIGALIAMPASAHERQVIRIGETPYIFTVGSLNEPVYVDDKTGVDLRIITADPKDPTNRTATGAKPMTGLEQTLKVELKAGEKNLTLPIEPAYQDPGAYRAPFYPTVATTYTYRFFGTIDGKDVDLSFTCNPAGHPATPEDTSSTDLGKGAFRIFKSGAFGCPKPRGDRSFPEPAETIAHLSADHLADHQEDLNDEPESSSNNLAHWSLGLSILALLLAVWSHRKR